MTNKTRCMVLDTNVLLADPESIFKFKEHIVIIPIAVITEIDSKKKEIGEIGYAARQFSRNIDMLREKGKLIDGVPVNDEGGILYVALFDNTVANCLPFQDMSIMDNRIMATAVWVKNIFKPEYEVILVSKDVNVRVMSDCFNIIAEDYKNDKINSDEFYTGVNNVNVSQELIEKIYKLNLLELNELELECEPYPNECFILHNIINPKQSALVRYNGIMKTFKLLPNDLKTVDIIPRSAEQQFALDMLKDPDLHLVSLQGRAGSGKTLLSLAAGLYGVLETQRYAKVLLLKPIVPMDNNHELGFLPGSMEEKLAPWMASYSDNIELIMQNYIKDEAPSKAKKSSKKELDTYSEKVAAKINPIQELISLGLIEMGSLEHFRGRSLNNMFIILDESQNTTKNSIKTIVSRCGEGTKIVIMGDISQIDSPYLDSKSNGLSICANAFKSESIAGHITLKKSERSKLAEIATNIL